MGVMVKRVLTYRSLSRLRPRQSNALVSRPRHTTQFGEGYDFWLYGVEPEERPRSSGFLCSTAKLTRPLGGIMYGNLTMARGSTQVPLMEDQQSERTDSWGSFPHEVRNLTLLAKASCLSDPDQTVLLPNKSHRRFALVQDRRLQIVPDLLCHTLA